MKIQKCIALVLSAVLLLSLTGCAGKYEGKLSGVKYYNFLDPYYNESEADLLEKMPQPRMTLDPQEIYDSIEYDERMFYGTYRLYNQDKDREKFAKTAEFMELTYSNDYGNVRTETMTVLPVAFEAGPTEMYMSRYDRSQEWASVRFASTSGGYECWVTCTFSVSGHQITFTPLEYLNTLFDEEYHITGYEYTLGSQKLTYDFEFDGPRLTLSNDSGSVTLCSYYYTKGPEPHASGMLAPDSDGIGKLDSIYGYINEDLFDYYSYLYLDINRDKYPDEYIRESGVRLYDNGLIDLFWVEEDANDVYKAQSYQFVYFGTGPMVLTDGKNIYYYTENYTTREMLLMGDGMSTEDLIEFENMGEEAQKDVVQKKANLLKDLSDAYEAAGLTVHINHSTGEIAMDAGVLFGTDQSQISEEGKAFLKDFLGVYTSVVFGDEYTDFVSKIMVEGHTDTAGAYDYNMELSLKRAENVMAFCLSGESGVSAEQMAALQSTLEAVGYSYDKPIYDENGEVDMDASRRVSFRFVINIGD